MLTYLSNQIKPKLIKALKNNNNNYKCYRGLHCAHFFKTKFSSFSFKIKILKSGIKAVIQKVEINKNEAAKVLPNKMHQA